MGRRSKRKPRQVSGHLFEAGLKLLGLGVLLLVLSFVFGTSSGPLRPLAQGLRVPVPWLLALGALIATVGWVTRPRLSLAGAAVSEPPFTTDDPPERSKASPNRSGKQGSPPAASPTARTSPAWGPRPPATTWSARVFEDIEWRRFETLCSLLFEQAGFQPRSQSHGADGGVDIWLHSRNADGPVAVVQCKHWQGKQVGVKEIREFFGVMASRKVSRGTYATTSTFTGEAARFGKENGIHLLDGQGLLDLIAKRTPQQQQALLEHAYEGEYWRPTCANCGTKMVERTVEKNGKAFWGCQNYPRCQSTLPMRAV